MKAIFALFAVAAATLVLASCTPSNSSGGGGASGEYYAPTPESSIDRAAKLQYGLGTNRSNVY